MKKLCTLVALAALAASLPTASIAAKSKATPTPSPSGTPSPTATPAASKPIPMYSEVTTIDASGKSWTHKNKNGKEVKFQVTDKTDIKNNGAAAKFEDIKVGDWVAGSRLKQSETEYEVVKITKFGARTEKSGKSEKSTAPSATPTKSN